MEKPSGIQDSVIEEIAEVLCTHMGSTAWKRLRARARFSKQSVREMARRTATNLVKSFTTRRPL
jgi:hypothetical protein